MHQKLDKHVNIAKVFLSHLTHNCTVFGLLQAMEMNPHLPLELEPNTSGMH